MIISGYVKTGPKDVVIPADIGEVPVTVIGNAAFSAKGINSVQFPESIKKINQYAFYGNNLSELALPNSVEQIGGFAFQDNALTSVQLSNSLTEIAAGVFYNNGITYITIPDSVTKIGYEAFKGNQLSILVLPDSVTEVGSGAFSANKLEEIYLPQNLVKLGDYAFADNLLTSVFIPDSVTNFGVKVFHRNEGEFAPEDFVVRAYKADDALVPAENFAATNGYRFEKVNPKPQIQPTSAIYDRYAPVDITVSITPYEDELEYVLLGEYELQEEEFTVLDNGTTVVIHKQFLARLAEEYHEIEERDLRIDFRFKSDESVSLTITYTDSSPPTGVYAFGQNQYSQLGLGHRELVTRPTLIPDLTHVKDVSAGYEHSLVLLKNGDVYAFGNNSDGQLGLEDNETRLTPVKGLKLGKRQIAPTCPSDEGFANIGLGSGHPASHRQ